MGIRERLNRSPALVAGAAVFALAVAVYVISSQSTDGGSTVRQVFCSNDDGKTFFKDSVDLVAPFERDGKLAYRAFVVECHGKRSVAYLERYTDKAKPIMEKVRAELAKGAPESKFQGDLAWISRSGIEYKRPGDTQWVQPSDARIIAVRDLKCSDGSPGDLVLP